MAFVVNGNVAGWKTFDGRLRCRRRCRPSFRPGLVSMVLASGSSSSSPSSAYTAAQITVLEGLEPVRKRPGMYIGSTGVKGLHHLVYEVVDNAVDEALAGFCRVIIVTLEQDGSVTVQDDGRGIPVEIHTKTGTSALETVMTVLHAGGKFGMEGSGYKVSGGLHGVGVSVVNALSRRLDAMVWRDGRCYRLGFERGLVVDPLTEEVMTEEECERTGTQIRFWPDPEIFRTEEDFMVDVLTVRFRELAFLNAGLRIVLRDQRIGMDGENVRREVPEEYEFCYHGGILEYVEMLAKERVILHGEVIFMEETMKGVEVQVALCWASELYSDNLIGFANNIRTKDGGSHMEGFKTAVTKTVNGFAKELGKIKDSSFRFAGEFVREGLIAVVSVKLPEPEFEGQTKSRLGNPEIRGIVENVVSRNLHDFFELHPQGFNALLEKISAACEASEAARKARDLVRRKTVLESSTLPGKLADCVSREPSQSEVFIVEGESAGGSAKQGRDRHFQAILPLRGKILNVERTQDSKVYGNKEIQALITALGLGLKGEEFSEKQLRYHRIIIMTDADIDGAHIRTLLLTFFYRFRREAIEGGYVYIACPPLYKIERARKSYYFYNDAELQSYMQSLPETSSRPHIQRFKGLGEMMPRQLWDTTMNPETRRMKRVDISDAVEADQIFSTLMGETAEARRTFIEAHAQSLNLSDLDF